MPQGLSESGGTVRYHRADWVGGVAPNFPWRVQFTPDDGPVAFTAEQGEVMGLTPPGTGTTRRHLQRTQRGVERPGS